MASKIKSSVYSEIGDLSGVILHTPGKEIENMTPGNAEKALYSDILNKNIVDKEYSQFKQVLEQLTPTYEIKDLLEDALSNEKVKYDLVSKITNNENVQYLHDYLMSLEPRQLVTELIEGVVMEKDNLTKFLSKQRYALMPLHNFFFTRDSAVSLYDKVLIGRMASMVRDRESIIMETIFDFSSQVGGTTFNPVDNRCAKKELMIEGGDVLVARDDILLVGQGSRTSTQGVDYLIERFKRKKKKQHILVQEMPYNPESFIHLDMVFSFLDKDQVMTFDPLIFRYTKYITIHITIDNGKVDIREEENLLQALKKLGMDLEPIPCGGPHDIFTQEREQWHSGANFFAIGPGKIMGYERNVHTIETLNNRGYEVLKAKDIIRNKVNPADYQKYVITIEGSELPRGGGGCRCMTMPLKRESVQW
ncbi:MAG: arginine deiminase [Bacteroidales bacterium]|nr:arginine deiminase [Bacteroidales bacterium]MCF8337251.1 arginine deiminase [Bacteroidales bacterium]